MNKNSEFIRLLQANFKLWKYSYTIHANNDGNLQVTGYLWSNEKPSARHILGSLSSDKTLSYVLEVEYQGQSLEQTIKYV